MDRSADRVSVRLERPAPPLTPALSDLLSRGATPAPATRSAGQTASHPPTPVVEGAKLTRSMALRLSFALIVADIALVGLGFLMVTRASLAIPSWMGSSIGATAIVLGAWLAWLAYWVRGMAQP